MSKFSYKIDFKAKFLFYGANLLVRVKLYGGEGITVDCLTILGIDE